MCWKWRTLSYIATNLWPCVYCNFSARVSFCWKKTYVCSDSKLTATLDASMIRNAPPQSRFCSIEMLPRLLVITLCFCFRVYRTGCLMMAAIQLPWVLPNNGNSLSFPKICGGFSRFLGVCNVERFHSILDAVHLSSPEYALCYVDDYTELWESLASATLCFHGPYTMSFIKRCFAGQTSWLWTPIGLMEWPLPKKTKYKRSRSSV